MLLPPRLWGFPSVRPPRTLLLDLFQICPCFLLVHLLLDSVESQFLRDGVLPTGRVSSVGGFLPSFSWFRFLSLGLWYPSSSGQSSLLPSTLVKWVPPLRRRVFLGVSLPLFVAGWCFSRLRLFVSLPPFCCSPYFEGFPSTLILGYRFHLRLHLCYPIPLIYFTFLIVGGETLVSSLASFLRSSASLLQCLLGRCT